MPQEGILFASCGQRVRTEVVGFFRNDVAHPSSGILHISLIARDNMYMEVHNGLAGSFSCIKADVIAVRRELPIQAGLYLRNRPPELCLLFGARLEVGSDVPPWNDQRMAGRDWM